MRDVGLGNKVYSPDLQTYELEGPTGLFGTIASIVVGPVRLLFRVSHNILILPANLLASYAEGLLLVSLAMGILGVLDLVVFHKWPLLASQVPVVILAVVLKSKADGAIIKAQEKKEVEIDSEQVEELCKSIYGELDAALGKEQNNG